MNWKKFGYYTFGIFTGFLCLLATLLATPWGSRATIAMVNTLPMLQLDYKRGSIIRDIEFTRFELDLDDIQIHAENLHLDLHLRCLVNNRVCIKALEADTFYFGLISTTESSGESGELASEESSADEQVDNAEDNDLVVMPIGVRAENFRLGSSQIVINDIDIRIEQFSAGVDLDEEVFLIIKPEASSLIVSIPKNEVEEPEATTESDEWPLANLPRINIPLDLQLQELAVGHTELKIADGLEQFDDIKLSARWLRTGLAVTEFALSYLDIGQFGLAGDVDLVHPYPMDLALTSSLHTLTPWPEAAGSDQELKLSGDVSDLSLALVSQGSLALTMTGHANAESSQLPFDINLDATHIPLPAEYTELVEPSTLAFVAKGDIDRQALNLTSQLRGFGYQDATINVELTHSGHRLELTEVSLFDAGTNSDLNIKGGVGYGERVAWQLALQSTGLSLPEFNPELSGRIEGEFTSSGHWQGESWSAGLDNTLLSGQINDIPITLKGDASLDQSWHLQPSHIDITANDTVLSLRGYSDTEWHVDGVISVPQIGSWVNETRGDVDGKLNISGDLLDPKIRFDGNIEQLFWQTISTPAIALEVDYYPAQSHSGVVLLQGDLLRLDKMTLTNIFADIDANIETQSVKLRFDGDASTDIELHGKWSEDDMHWAGELKQAVLGYQALEWRANKPVSIGFDAELQRVALTKHCWVGAGLDLCMLDDADLGADGELKLGVQLDVATLDELFMPPEVEVLTGIDGEIDMRWAPDQAFVLNADLNIAPGQTLVQQNEDMRAVTTWQQGKITLNLDEAGVKSSMSLLESQNVPLLVIDTDLTFGDEPQIDGRITLSDIDLQPVQAFVPELSVFNGTLGADLTVKGAASKPQLFGELGLRKGHVELVGSPTKFEQLNFVAKVDGSNAKFDGNFLIAEDKAVITGSADWQDDVVADLHFNAEQLTVLFPPQVMATFSPDLHANLNKDILKLSGRVDVLDGILRIEKLPEGTVGVSKDVVVVDDNGDQVIESQRLDVETDIRIAIAETFKVEGQGFNGRLGGEIQVSQKQHQPLQLFGNLSIPEGRYRAYGQRLSVEKGLISFNGPSDNPYVDLRAVREIKSEDVTVGIEVKGLANALELSLFSDPSMQQPETLSYLVRGRGLDAETGNSAAVGMAIGAGLTNSSGVLEQLERLPLLSNLEVSTEGDGDDTQATISGYVGERIYLKYGVGVYEPINELTARFYFMTRLWVETVTGIENSADIYYSFDIE